MVTKQSTFSEVYSEWLEQYSPTVSDSTVLKTKQEFKNHILPSFGKKVIGKITNSLCVREATVWDTKVKRSDRIINYASKVFVYAITKGILDKNPIQYVTPNKKIAYPKSRAKKSLVNSSAKKTIYNRIEIEQLFRALHQEKDENHLTYKLLATTGIKPSELCALTWADLDFEEKTLLINKSVSRGQNGLFIEGIQGNGVRILKFTPDLEKLFIKLQQKNNGKQMIINPSSKAVNSFKDPNTLNITFKKILEKNELREIPVSELRFVATTLMFDRGENIQEVNLKLGLGEDLRTIEDYIKDYESCLKKS